jgi:hypothetical protein
VIKPFQIILGIVSIAAVTGMYILFCTSKKQATKAPKQVATSTAAAQVLNVDADSFIALMNKAYGSLLSINKQGRQLQLVSNSANQVSADIFNGADQLLGNHEKEGFTINFNNQTNQTTASFALDGNFASIPSDVLIAAMNKAYGSTSIPKK